MSGYRKLIGLRNELNIKQKDIAITLGISIKTYSFKERKISEFTLTEAFKLMKFFNKSFYELFG